MLAGSVLMMAGAGLAVRVVEREASELGYAVSLRRRPPARLNTAWVLVWATSVAAAGSVLAALIVNQLAALLVLGGALVYVLARSLMLEAKAERTVAAAGAAAAVQVLAGWAAATGRLEAPALVLFAMAACWTGFGLAPRKRGVLALALVAMSFVFAVVEGSGWRFWAACSVTGLLFLVGSARVGRLRPGAVATVGTVRATSLWSLLHAAAFLYAAVWLGLPAR